MDRRRKLRRSVLHMHTPVTSPLSCTGKILFLHCRSMLL
jgi:hypothetical protein